jgi:hypothetical protein
LTGDLLSGRERRESEKFILFLDCYNAVNLRPAENYLSGLRLAGKRQRHVTLASPAA